MNTNNRKEGTIDVLGGKIWYRSIAGGSLTPILILHGGPGATHDYLEPLEGLAIDRNVIVYDQLGGGNSDRPNDKGLWTIDRFVNELATLRDFLKLEELFILGSSWGATLAVAYMLKKRASGIKGLILSGPFLSSSRWENDQRAYISELPSEVRETILRCEKEATFSSDEYQEAMMLFYKRHLCRLEPWPKCLTRTLEKMGEDVYHTMWGPSEFTMTGTLKDLELAERLNEINVPLLITCGEFDEATPSSCKYFASCSKRAELRVFDGASHSHHIEKTAEYLATVTDFMRRNDK